MTSSIDAMYGGFADGLPAGLRGLALNLPHVLGLAPAPGIGWSDVFSHRVTLEAPALVAEAFPEARAETVRDAVFAHALSVIEAFGVDRIADKQVLRAPELLALLKELRSARNRLLERILPAGAEMALAADRETAAGIREERSLLSRIGAATFQDYRHISLAKQAVGFPASLALAMSTAAHPQRVEMVKRMLAGVWLGLQYQDDAADWEDDWKRGCGAWAVSLARRRLESVKQQTPDERPTEPDLVRRRVFRMGILYLMLQSARHQYRTARRYARSLGAHELFEWAQRRIDKLDEMLPLEQNYPGFVVRACKLAPWAAEVLT